MTDRLNDITQQMLLALLCCSKTHGAQVGMQVSPDMFDGVRQDIAVEVYKYRSKYDGKPPGRRNLLVLVENMPLSEERLKSARAEARDILALYKKGFNADHIVSLGQQFAKRQLFKRGIRQAGELVLKGAEVEEIEKVLHQTIRLQPNVVQPGFRLSDPKALDFLTRVEDGWSLGIRPFDRVPVLLKPGEMTLYVAPKNTGKSWACVHVGRTCIVQGAKVLHVSLEMSAQQVSKRYFQNWFGMSTVAGDEFQQAKFETDNLGRVTGWKLKHVKPKLRIADGNIKKQLQKRIDQFYSRLNNLVVTDFPTGSLTIGQLENYLDTLASTQQFQPDVLIVDYPDLMKVNRSNYRLELGDIFIQLRGLAIKRNLALFVPTQTNRSGMESKRTSSVNVSEDVSKVFTADIVLTYSQTLLEKANSLARLRLMHIRDAPVGMEVCLVHNYNIGQYVCDAALSSSKYMELVTSNDEDSVDKVNAKFGEEYLVSS